MSKGEEKQRLGCVCKISKIFKWEVGGGGKSQGEKAEIHAPPPSPQPR